MTALHTTNSRKAAVLAGLFISMGGLAPAFAEESHPGLGMESMYSEAVLAYNKKQTGEALQILNQILIRDPQYIQALELKALTLKSKGDDKQSIDVYRKLIEVKPAKERGPYHFELGVLYHKQKNGAQARIQFERAVQLKFNETVSQMFLGLIAFTSEQMRLSEYRFRKVLASPSQELQMVAHYYLGLIHFKDSYGSGGTQEMIRARRISLELTDNQMAKDIGGAAGKILAPFTQGQWFGSMNASAGYDSNVPSIASSEATSGKASSKLNVGGGAGRMSAPMETWQWVGSYRFSYNKNLNSATRGYEYFTNSPSLFINYDPMEQSNGGLKMDGSFVFKNQPREDDSASYVMSKYSLGLETGPFVKHQFSRAFQIEADFFLKPTRYYGEDESLSGTGWVGRLIAKSDPDSPYLAPMATLSFEKGNSRSVEYRTNVFGVGVLNSSRFSSSQLGTISLDYSSTTYPLSELGRKDTNFMLRGSWIIILNPRWSLTADASYSKNVSSLPEAYSYDRATFSFGTSWSL